MISLLNGEKMYSYIINKPSNLRKDTKWYTFGSMSSSISSILLLVIVSRTLNSSETGVFSMAWAISQLAFSVGLFGTRNFQVSSLDRTISTNDFFLFKLFNIFLMFTSTFIYTLILNLDKEKMIIAFLLTFLMSSESFADFLSGTFQSFNKLWISGQSYLFRIVLYDFIFFIVMLCTHNLSKSLFITGLFSYTWLFLFDFQLLKQIVNLKIKLDYKNQKILFIHCFPIFISAFLTIFIMNSPKNNIELYSNDATQAIYNIISMPSAVINLLSSFILVPLYVNIANSWNQKNKDPFYLIVKKVLILIFVFTVMVSVLGGLLGPFFLKLFFGINIKKYQLELIVLLIAGGLNSLINFLVYLLTVFKIQKYLLIIYSFIAISSVIYTKYFVKNYLIFGGAISYLISVSFIAILIGCLLFFYKKNNK